ncbi:MAG TPA: acetate kinase [Epulopiscium sp.]|nr:acetate kinase [Candidatus Epulonipiscium sp.]
MKVLVINCGSSSLKYQLLDMSNENLIAIGNCERIGIDGSFIKHTTEGQDAVKESLNIPDHKVAFAEVVKKLTTGDTKCIENMDEIAAVGHRVVHGGEKFSESVIITAAVKAAIEECSELAPLHNPPNLIGINACEELMPNTPMMAVFDTAFHQTMPKEAYAYAIPNKYYEKYGIRKYGFHGTSHKYVATRVAALLGKQIEDTKIIVCHLGNGASICAVDGGKSVETSMGFTPLAGLVMGTRSGDIDPAVVTFLMEKENMTTTEVNNMLNKESGVLALSGISSDFREIEDGVVAGDPVCRFTMDAYQHRLISYIGSYAALMNGVDAIAFTAGLGENNIMMRNEVCDALSWMGVKADKDQNKCRGKECDFSAEGATVRTMVIPTNEELMIARDAVALLAK